MLWEIDIYPAPGQPDLLGRPVSTAAAELGLAHDLKALAARGYLVQADWDRRQVERVAWELLADRIVEKAIVAEVGDEAIDWAKSRRKRPGWNAAPVPSSTCFPSRA